MKTLFKWTIKEYHHLINTGIFVNRRVELLHGEIVEMSPESPIHTQITETSVEYLRSLLKDLAYVREAHPITLSNSEPQPDIAIAHPPRNNYYQRHPYPEDIFLLIEIANTTLGYDLGEKKQAYAKAKILEYWVVDVENRQIYVFRHPQADNYGSEIIFRQGKINPLAFPDISVSVSSFFAEN
ncbi:MAG: Uma2 family endonuclease [Okeania sp. SIO2G4]|uniref:Uma2 family endonuclease n=1 Tax=unclassified Okeania TaxID=2634635 RepID=UPI0013BE4588|nr:MULTISPECIES: Uma2 family endonuclease [unclassified Okeania]NEP05220.1 Uma2 family endonuclease [Okeania sp. SIO4D6]NEP41542.1 Uma2 family endonuclease [Okeania sp. SIO2H7]NEP71278.1 Uma2 family endonuclease [Okeania sp. SIO2G5]NEP92185.1 Uma2 family endonuclease [Okeania sp. SIO2F5]NEQ90221.1 Uma2 family endonuclease [Okeania sp. SIO2G4]